jgi:hypothetical protein
MTKVKSLPKLKAELQLLFNQFIRLRDKGKPCISCGKPEKYLQAGHFYSVRMYDGLRFNEDNCHGECAGCNGFDDMHLLGYASNLIDRIGDDGYTTLQCLASAYKRDGYRWTRSELLEKIEHYKNEIKTLNNEN